MQKKTNQNENPYSFDRQSHFNNDRDSYIDQEGNYVYTEWVKVGKTWERRVVDIIPLNAENRDIIILLDGSDHDMDLGDEYEEKHRDYGTQNKKAKQADADDDYDGDPIEEIADPRGDAMDILYPETAPIDPLVKKTERFIEEKLLPQQADMVYGHLGEGRFLEEMRREEVERTGKDVKKQSYYGRWDKIITKGCKYFGVEKPKKQKHRKSEVDGD